jgi:predicted metalloprotease with PDZ domain
LKRLLFVVVFLSLISPALAQTTSIDYTLAVKNPVMHLYDVQIEIGGIRTTSIDVAMPAWSPGVYTIRDFARNVQEFEATTRQNRSLSWEQVDKQTWRITKSAGDDVRVHYRVYSTTLNDELADVTPAAVFMYVAGQTQSPLTVKYEADGDWKAYTSLEKRGDRYYAPNYEVLATSPALVGEFKVFEIKSNAGIPYRIVFSNPKIQLTQQQIEADIEDLANGAAALFGKVPFKDFTFLVRVQATPGASHIGYLNSTRIVIGENDFVNQNAYDGFLLAAAQGLVKAWNGIRTRPASMLPYDFSKEAYSRVLWFTDGVSAFWADMLLLRARILSSTEYLLRVSAEVDALQHQPGRRLTSLEEASWNAWTRGDNTANAGISHQLKGKIAGLLLDAEIRAKTGGSRSTDDVLRYLAAEVDQKNTGLTDNLALASAIQAATGVEVGEFFNEVIRGRGEIDYNRYMEKVGLHATAMKGPASLTLGIEFERIEANQARIRRVLPGSSAEAAKLDAGDVIIAMDSERVTFDNLASRIHSKQVGKTIVLNVMRGERLLSLNLMGTATQTETWSISASNNPTPEQRRLRDSLLAEGPNR